MWEIKLSELFYSPNSVFAKVFEAIGEAPALIPLVYTVVVIVGIIFKKRVFNDGKREIIGFSFYLMMTVLITATAVGTIKHLCGRARFYELSSPDYLGYTPFYIISDFGGSSFPSGHAAMSTLSILLYDINKKHKIFAKNGIIIAFSVVFVLLVVVSRLVAGAHFITDLVFGVVIALSVRWIVKLVYRKAMRKSHRDL